MLLILVILLIMAAIGLLPSWPYAAEYHYGYYPSGLVVVIVIILIVLLVSGRGL